MLDYFIIFCVGLLSHLIGTLVGGGGLISLPTMLFLGIPIHSAIAAEKLGAACSSLLNCIYLLITKGISIKDISWLFALGLLSGISGGFFSVKVSEGTLTIIAICLMGFALIISFLGTKGFGDKEEISNKWKIIPTLFGVGFYDGIFGPGSSTLSLYVFSSQNIQYVKSVIYTRASLLAWCIGALIPYISSGKMIWLVAFSLTAGAIIGGQIGLKLTNYIKKEHVTILLRIVTVIMMLQLMI
ncbi:TSUP family transporter [Ureibacillus chungkukjangi]|uniref:sulfite exporter TauE/SafE family protein n=1 Tax=Ureibacillus chungkukjangi TaxID=1202712 RepID=UPI00204209C6|nr:TSUP family transporter [Ureibacillus chungkukjangi]MCM3387042.1 TSUP family transporter [Ureibacillus chungkukjangi]